MKVNKYELEYEFSALEPYIDALTMEIHSQRHHTGYMNNTNAILEANPEVDYASVEELLKNLSELPEAIQTGLRNNGGGVFNHDFFFSALKVTGSNKPEGALLAKIEEDFGSFEAFKAEFDKAAKTRFGSGWAWLLLGADGKLVVTSSANQDVPFELGKPILNLDVWEHAYYLKYQNKRPEYVENYFNAVNWAVVAERL